MKTRNALWTVIVLMFALGILLVACDGDGEDEDEEGAEGNPAMVDSVTVEDQASHK